MRIAIYDIEIKTATAEDMPELNDIYREACGYFGTDTLRPLTSPAACMAGGDVPRGGRTENYELLSISVSGTIIGYMSVYRDFPAKETVQIPFIFISERARACGFGSTIVDGVCRYFYEAGYGSVRVSVSLRKYGALRFWYNHGFNAVVSLNTEGYNVCEGSYAGIGLERSLR